MDFLFGADTPLAVRFFIAFVIVLALIGGTAYLVRRFGGERLAAAGGRGRQPRLAVVDAAAVDGRRRLILIRRDNIEHLLLIGGPTDVVVEPNILRAAAAAREGQAPPRQPTATETLPRAVPLGEGSMWPLQPQAEPAPPPPAPAPRPQRPPPVEEPATQWHAEPEPPPPAPPPPTPQRQPRQADPLTGLAADLARTAPQGEPAALARRPPRAPVREQPRAPVREAAEPNYDNTPESHDEPAPSAQAQRVEPSFASPADQNLAEMAHRLEAALRRPGKKPEEARIAEFAPKVPLTAMEPLPVPPPAEPKPARAEGRPMRTEPRGDAPRGDTPRAEAPRMEAPRAEAPRAESRQPPRGSLYDSLEQEMASLLGRPNKN